MEQQMVDAMRRAGIDEARIYAFRKTGLMPSEENEKFLSSADIREWNAAIEEFEKKASTS